MYLATLAQSLSMALLAQQAQGGEEGAKKLLIKKVVNQALLFEPLVHPPHLLSEPIALVPTALRFK